MIKKELTSTIWLGRQIDMPGLYTSASEVFGEELRLTFEKNGKCFLEVGNERMEAKWKIKGDKLHLRGKQMETKGFIDVDPLTGTLDSFLLLDIENYSVTFYSEKYLEKLSEKIEKNRKEEETQLSQWIDALGVDLSSCTPQFVKLLKFYDFQDFELVERREEEKENFMEEHFLPLLSLGLQHTSWISVYQHDADRLLRGYEIYELNLKLDPKERSRREGEVVYIPYQEIERFIGPRIHIAQEPLRDLLEEMLKKSTRYSPNPPTFEMKITEDLGDPFVADVLEAWKLKTLTVIHMLYGAGNRAEDHAWFLLEKNEYIDGHRYLGGSAFEPEL